MAILLVLGSTEIALSLSERYRLDDLRRESVALAETWAKYLTRLAPTGDSTAIAQGLAGWPSQHIASTAAAVWRRDGSSGLRLIASSGPADSIATPEDFEAIGSNVLRTWQVQDTAPAWRVAMPLGGNRPFGVLSVEVSTKTLQAWARLERKRAYVFGLVAALLLAVGVAWLTSRWVGRPLIALGMTLERAHTGVESAPPADEIGPGEFRGLARRYNDLRTALSDRQRESEARGALLTLEEQARGFDRLAMSEETAAAFAHEIGAPLNTLSGHLQLLRDDLSTGGPSPALDRVHLLLGQIDRLTRIVRSRLERGAWPTPRLRPTNLGDLAERVLQFFEPTLVRQGVKGTMIRAIGPDGETVSALCDVALVEQILLNLIKNAIEAMPDGGAIFVKAGGSSDNAWVEIRDTGPGLALEAKRQLFNPFVSTKGSAGTGLGLAVSQRLARSLGGDLVHLPTDRGTAWRLTLPAILERTA
jgi:two-component system, NtrC family, sensor kinase